MTNSEARLVDLIGNMSVHGGSAHPAPHKPALLALAVMRRGLNPSGPRLGRYEEFAPTLSAILTELGRPARPWYPFIRMRMEPFWELTGDLNLNSSGDIARVDDLRSPAVRAGFTTEYDRVVTDVAAARRVVDATCNLWLDTHAAATVMHHLGLPVRERT